MSTLQNEIAIAVRSGRPLVRIVTDEVADCLNDIHQLCHRHNWHLRVWDRRHGLVPKSAQATPPPTTTSPAMAIVNEAEPAYMVLDQLLREQAETLPKLTVFVNLHFSIDGMRDLYSALLVKLEVTAATTGNHVIVLTPAGTVLPQEIEPLFHVIEHELPSAQELEQLLEAIEIGDGRSAAETLAPEQKRQVVKAALGMTRMQASGAFCTCATRHKTILPHYVWEQKAELLNRERFVELHRTSQTFADIGGLEGAKQFLKKLCRYDPLEEFDLDVRAKGVIAVGPPGVGKTLLAYCLGNELDLPALKFNPGNLLDQYVGNTEKNTRKFFQLCRRMAPCIVIVDEVSQVMPAPTAAGDSGVSRRLLGSFLTAMNDIQEPVFWFFTANTVDNLHEAFLRAERVDAKLYVRLPKERQRAEIWSIYLRKFFPKTVGGREDPRYIPVDWQEAVERKLPPETVACALMCVPQGEPRQEALSALARQRKDAGQIVRCLVNDDQWTPAEIRSCCRLMRRLGASLAETAQLIHPICLSERGRALLERLDRWAMDDGAIDAETGQRFFAQTGTDLKPSRMMEVFA